MKKSILSIVIGLLGTLASSSSAAMMVHRTRAAWEAVCPSFDEEFFDDATFNVGVSVVTDAGQVDSVQGVWSDVMTATNTTTWSFATPITGFGADWDLAGPGGAGANIRMYLNGQLVGSEIPGGIAERFWGVTNGLFDQVLLTIGTGFGTETFEMDNMIYGRTLGPGVPEPASLAFLALGSLALLRRRRKQ